MDTRRVGSLGPVEIARAALRNMADRGLPPTPENYTREYRVIAGLPPQSEAVDLSPETIQMVQAIIDLVTQTTAELATGVDRFQAQTKPLLANPEAIGEKEFAELLRSFTVATLSLHQTVETSRSELVETRERLAEVTRELKRTEELARTDSLTGFCNRRAMNEIIAREIARARRTKEPFSIAILDIDHFKKVNDEYGHAVGDKALVHVAFIAKSGIRDTDVICRYGGEEFVVVLPAANAEGARFVIDRLRVMMEKSPLVLDKVSVTIRFSAGVAELTAKETAEAMLERADQALYEAKRTGRNRVVVAPARATERKT